MRVMKSAGDGLQSSGIPRQYAPGHCRTAGSFDRIFGFKKDWIRKVNDMKYDKIVHLSKHVVMENIKKVKNRR